MLQLGQAGKHIEDSDALSARSRTHRQNAATVSPKHESPLVHRFLNDSQLVREISPPWLRQPALTMRYLWQAPKNSWKFPPSYHLQVGFWKGGSRHQSPVWPRSRIDHCGRYHNKEVRNLIWCVRDLCHLQWTTSSPASLPNSRLWSEVAKHGSHMISCQVSPNRASTQLNFMTLELGLHCLPLDEPKRPVHSPIWLKSLHLHTWDANKNSESRSQKNGRQICLQGIANSTKSSWACLHQTAHLWAQ